MDWWSIRTSKTTTLRVIVKSAKWLPHLSQVNQTDPEHIAWNRTKGWKRGFLLLMMKTPKETYIFYCISKTNCHLGYKNGGRSTIGRTRRQNNMFEKVEHQHSTHRNNRILHIACHLPHERHASDVCHLKPWFQYQALCEGPAVR